MPGIGVPQLEQVALAVLLDGRSREVGDGGSRSGDRACPADPAGDAAAGLDGWTTGAAAAGEGRLRDSRSSSVSSVAKTSAGILPDARPIFGAQPNMTSYGRRPMP